MGWGEWGAGSGSGGRGPRVASLSCALRQPALIGMCCVTVDAFCVCHDIEREGRWGAS